jgi:hypothetical protein
MLEEPQWSHLAHHVRSWQREKMVQVWHKLDGKLSVRPDLGQDVHPILPVEPGASQALYALKKKVLIAPLSNGTVRHLIDLVRTERTESISLEPLIYIAGPAQ